MTLTVRPGTRVTFRTSPSTKTDPAFWHPGTELAVAGSLVVQGTPDAPVRFEGDGPWGGLVAAPGSSVELRAVRVRGAEEGLLCVGATCRLEATRFEGCEYGVVLGPAARLEVADSEVVDARVGVVDARGEGGLPPGLRVAGSRDAPRLTVPAPPRGVSTLVPRPEAPGRMELLGEYTVAGEERWSGEVILSGRVTVVPGAVLTLAPGTRVAFRKRDTNRDGLGEAELLVLGGIRSLGEPGRPVVFESAEPEPTAGDWDKVSLIAAEDPENRFQYTVFRHGTQALHAHFSRFVAEGCLFEDNLRAVQFQESEGARIVGSVFVRNKQALRFRDSKTAVLSSRFVDNLYAVHAFRAELEFRDNRVEGSVLGGFLARESRVVLAGNALGGNRDGVRVREPGSRVVARGNRVWDSGEDALSLSRVEGHLEGNAFAGAGLDLVSLEDSPVGLAGNAFGAAGRHALHLGGGGGVEATDNYWGPPGPEARIHHGVDDPALGLVRWAPARERAPALDLPPVAW